MKIIAIVLAMALTGCGFMTPQHPVNLLPTAPANLSTPCIRPLKLNNPEANKGDALDVVTGNYREHNLCADKANDWSTFYGDLVKKERERNKK